MDTLSKDLLKELECPVCYEHMQPPIRMCQNGHNICSDCRAKLDNCPTCRRRFLEVRNIALENLSRKIEQHCRYKTYGCKLSFPPDLVGEHEEICTHQPYKCPLAHAEGIVCDWSGSCKAVKNHIESVHRNRLTEIEAEKRVFIKKFDGTKVYSRVIFSCNQVFYQQFEVIDDIFYFIVQHVGPQNCDTDFKYCFKLENGDETIAMTFLTASYRVSIADIHKSGQCVKLFFDTVKNFLHQNSNLVFLFDVENC